MFVLLNQTNTAMKNILAFAGSNHVTSINRKLLQAATARISDVRIKTLDLSNYTFPIYGEDEENQSGIPDSIREIHTLFSEVDGFIIASPEHNGLLPAFFKNIIDWLSRINQTIFRHKPIMLISTSPGQHGGEAGLKILHTLMPFWGAHVVSTFSLARYHENFDSRKNIITNKIENEKLDKAIKKFMSAFCQVPQTVLN